MVLPVEINQSDKRYRDVDAEIRLRVEKWRVSYISVPPPFVVALANSELAAKYVPSFLPI